MSIDADNPRVGLREWIITRQLLERPLVAKAADRTIDQSRILARQIIVAQTARLRAAGFHRMNKYIGLCGQPVNDFTAARMVEVDAHTLLVPVIGQEGGRFVLP